MPRIDFRNVSDVTEFPLLPDGEYICQLMDVETDRTRSGDEMWKLRWTVDGGEHHGRLLFDNLVFSPIALPRVKLLCISCGLDVSEELDLTPEMLLNRRAKVSIYQDEYEDDSGQMKTVNRIAYEGYQAVPSDMESPPF